jgi:hypothetical protein
MLVKILAAFVDVHGFLPEASGFLPGSLSPAWVGATTDVHIPLIRSLSRSVMRWVSALGHACLIVCQVMNAPPSWLRCWSCFPKERRYPRGMAGCPNPSCVGLAMPPTWFNRRAMRSIRRDIYEVVINFLGKHSLSPGLEGGGGLLCDTRLSTWVPLEGSNCFHVCEP